MKLHNPDFLTREGEPITGRVPPRLHILSGQLTKNQFAQVAHAYKLFCDANKVALGTYQTRHRVLSDGTRIQMESNQGIDRVFVWAAPTPVELDLPHGFVVTTNWTKPYIYKRWPELSQAGYLPRPVQWHIAYNVQVPQARTPLGTDNMVMWQANGHYLNHTMALSANRNAMWDYKREPAANLWTDVDSIAFSLTVNASAGWPYLPHPVHFTKGDKIYTAGGDLLYSTYSSPAIRLVDPEVPTYLPSATTGNGAKLAMQHYRQAVIAPTSGISRMRFKSEAIVRDASTAYRADDTRSMDITLPQPVIVGAISTVNGLEEDISSKVYMFSTSIAYYGATVVTTFVEVGFQHTDDAEARSKVIEYDVSRTDKLGPQDQRPYELKNLIALAGATDVTWASLLFDLHYSPTIYWRGGEKSRELQLTIYDFPPGHYGVERYTINRVDISFVLMGTPRVLILLGWTDFTIFEGTAACNVSATRAKNTSYYRASPSIDFYYHAGYVTPAEAGSGPALNPADGYSEAFGWYAANDIRPTVIADIYNKYWGDPITVDIPMDKRITNEARYDYTSRYIIDYDHKGQFWAAIEVRVICSTLLWKEGYAYEGQIQPEPTQDTWTHLVTIDFISGWNKNGTTFIAAKKNLYTGTAVKKPLIEYGFRSFWNPYYYGTDYEMIHSITAHVPPVISPPIEACQQLMNLARHQGVNPNLAVEDVIPGGEAKSKLGIEFSHANPLKPHTKQVTGQLYARTFKLSDADISNALWLLEATKVRMNKTGAIGDLSPSDYYMPTLGSTITNTKFHIEVRDGVIVDWSDEFAGAPGNVGAGGSKTDREIKLNRV